MIKSLTKRLDYQSQLQTTDKIALKNVRCKIYKRKETKSLPLHKGDFSKLSRTEKHHQRKILGGVRVFSAKVA